MYVESESLQFHFNFWTSHQSDEAMGGQSSFGVFFFGNSYKLRDSRVPLRRIWKNEKNATMWQWMKVVENRWKNMRVVESVWKWMKVVEREWKRLKWMKVDEYGWKQMKMDENGLTKKCKRLTILPLIKI